MASGGWSGVRLTYHRPPLRTDVFVQKLVHRFDGGAVTWLEAATLKSPMIIDNTVALEDGASIVWFTFDDAWHDIGRFHNARGEFTGYYANMITPIVEHSATEWECTDLSLDVWLGVNGRIRLLDEAELDEALSNGAVSDAHGERARTEAQRIMEQHAAGTWPPPITSEWTLERVRTYKSE